MNKKRYVPLYLLVIGLTLLSILAVATPALAFEFKSGNNVIIPEGEVVEDDLYITAENFILEGTIKGDLVVFASSITIKTGGVIEEDLLAGGQSIIVDGAVQDDVRVGAAAIVFGSDSLVGDDLVAAGYSLETMTGSQVGGDALFAGYQAKLGGDIEGSLLVFANGLDLQGSVKGDVTGELGTAQDTPPFSPFGFIPNMPSVPTVPGGLTIGSRAQIGGDLEYTSEEMFVIPEGIVAGDETRIEPTPQPEEIEEVTAAPSKTSVWFRQNISNLLTLLVLGLLMAWLTPGFLSKSAQALRTKPWHSLGLGILSYAVIFFAVLILGAITVLLTLILGVITLGELVWATILAGIIATSIVVFVFVFSAAYLSKLVVSYVVARFLLERIKPEWAESRYWSMVLGVILFAILASIPYLGWLISVVAILFGLGALFLLEIEWIQLLWSRRLEKE
jgi:cytoskeletal protein CcmA (bactofilin family)